MQLSKDLQREIIYYCKDVFGRFVDENYLRKNNVMEVSLLQAFYDTCVDNYNQYKSYELEIAQIDDILKQIFMTQKTFDLFISKDIDVTEIKQGDIFVFSTRKLKDKQIKEQEQIKLIDNGEQ